MYNKKNSYPNADTTNLSWTGYGYCTSQSPPPLERLLRGSAVPLRGGSRRSTENSSRRSGTASRCRDSSKAICVSMRVLSMPYLVLPTTLFFQFFQQGSKV